MVISRVAALLSIVNTGVTGSGITKRHKNAL